MPSEGYKDSKKSKELPKLRGEKWLTWDNRKVVILSRLRHGAVEVLNERGTTEVLYGSEFIKRLDVP